MLLTKLLKMKNEYFERANLTLKFTSMLDTKDLWCVPGIAANTLQPVEIIFVENLGEHTTKHTI